MREKKVFFNKNNKLDKGHGSSLLTKGSDDSFYRRKFEHILPPIDLISQYEDINPGTLQRLIDLTEQEQKNRHHIDLLNAENKKNAIKFGQASLLVFILIVSVTAALLTIFGAIKVAIIFSIFALFPICLASVLYHLNKAKTQKRYDGFRNHENDMRRNNTTG